MAASCHDGNDIDNLKLPTSIRTNATDLTEPKLAMAKSDII